MPSLVPVLLSLFTSHQVQTNPGTLENSPVIPTKPLVPLARGPLLVCCPRFGFQPGSHFSFVLQPRAVSTYQPQAMGTTALAAMSPR